ncbi:hypothetical protein FM101_09855 [Arthrobacter rhombi]|uniref:Uncharacterized protein n=1 Tax=Arthrobacter rhombi TaxID=71253 RepID=A0A1R4GE23_9MICC|nr:hypothetical protein FM101_09855 [Arthrobacter rhombi]
MLTAEAVWRGTDLAGFAGAAGFGFVTGGLVTAGAERLR